MKENVYNGQPSADKIQIYKNDKNEYVTLGNHPRVSFCKPNQIVARSESEILEFVNMVWTEYKVQCTITVERDENGNYCQPDYVQHQKDKEIDY